MDRHLQIGTFAPADIRVRRLRPLSRWQRRRELRAARRRPDAELLASDISRRTAWRAGELTAPESRRAVARSIRRLIRSADGRYLPGAAPLNRLAVREQSADLLALAEWLEDPSRLVTARGVLMVDELLADEYGPLFVSYRGSELRWALTRIAKALQTS